MATISDKKPTPLTMMDAVATYAIPGAGLTAISFPGQGCDPGPGIGAILADLTWSHLVYVVSSLPCSSALAP